MADPPEWRSGILASAVGLAAPNLPHTFCRYFHFLSELYFRSEFYFRFYAHTSTSRARDRVTMAEDGPAPGRVTAGVGFPGRWDGTQLAGQVGATYVTVWI